MRVSHSALFGLGAIGLAAGLAAQEPANQTAELSYKALKKWSYHLPNETWTEVVSGLPIPHQNGDSFAAHTDGLALALNVDTDGDGKTDKTVKGAKGYLVLRAKDAAGESLHYAVRFKAENKKYKFASSGVMRGKLADESVLLFDQNNNGIYNEVGVDAIVVGKSKSAAFLSKTVNLDGQLYDIQVSADGKKIDAVPFAGEVGTLDLDSEFDSKGKLISAVVRSADGNSSFQLADDSLKVPVGDYVLAYGKVEKANETVEIKQGKMETLSVRPGRETTPKWGGPLMAEFAFAHRGENVTIEPSSLHYYGVGGEEYVNFEPMAKSPKFFVHDERTEKLLKTGRFGTWWGGDFTTCTVRAGTKDDVFVTVELEPKTFGKITGRAGVRWSKPEQSGD